MQRSNKARDFILLFGTAEEAVEKCFFCALRFATRMPAAARKYDFPATYGTSKPFMGHRAPP